MADLGSGSGEVPRSEESASTHRTKGAVLRGSPSAFVVYLHLWRRSLGAEEPTIQTSLRDIAERTGFSKRGVQEALSVLSRRQLVGITRQSITEVPVYTVKRPWRR